jgi:hypothetical protein
MELTVPLDIKTSLNEPGRSKLAIELWKDDECIGRSELNADRLDRLITTVT